MYDGWQRAQQDVGVAAAECKVPADDIVLPTFVRRRRITVLQRFKKHAVVDRRERQIRREAERPPTRQKETVSGWEEYGFRDALQRQPALAGDHGIQLNPLMLWKLDGQVAIHR